MGVSFKDAIKKIATRIVAPIQKLGRTRAILLLSLFFLFAITGYFTGQLLGRSVVGAARISTPTANPVGFAGYANQHNYLFIHADTLNKIPPKLISVRIALITDFEGEPFIHFKSIYPNSNAPFMQTVIANAFSIGSDGKPVSGFFKQIDRYNIHFDGYILVDDQAATTLTEYLDKVISNTQTAGQAAFPGAAETPVAPDNQDMYPIVETRWIQTLCQFLGERNSSPPPYQKWSEVMPDHLRTDLNFDTLALTWERLTTAPKSTKCKLVDPLTGLPKTVDPLTGLPKTVDPLTGLPKTVDPLTGLPKTVDP